MDDAQLLRYSRHILLNELGIDVIPGAVFYRTAGSYLHQIKCAVGAKSRYRFQ